MAIASEKHHVPTRIENFLVSEWLVNVSWSSCRWGDQVGRAFLEGLCRAGGQSTLLDRWRGPGLGSHSPPSGGGRACKEWETTFLSPEIASSQSTK